MRLRDALPLILASVAAAGCGGHSYVTTSLGKQHHVEPAVNRISEDGPTRSRPGDAGMQRDLAGIPGLLSAGDFDGVKRIAADVLKRQPGSIEAHTYMAVALERSGDAAGAGRHYLRASELAPDSGAVLGNYGIWLCRQGHAADGLGWLDRALAKPGYADSPLLLANAGACAESRMGVVLAFSSWLGWMAPLSGGPPREREATVRHV